MPLPYCLSRIEIELPSCPQDVLRPILPPARRLPRRRRARPEPAPPAAPLSHAPATAAAAAATVRRALPLPVPPIPGPPKSSPAAERAGDAAVGGRGRRRGRAVPDRPPGQQLAARAAPAAGLPGEGEAGQHGRHGRVRPDQGQAQGQLQEDVHRRRDDGVDLHGPGRGPARAGDVGRHRAHPAGRLAGLARRARRVPRVHDGRRAHDEEPGLRQGAVFGRGPVRVPRQRPGCDVGAELGRHYVEGAPAWRAVDRRQWPSCCLDRGVQGRAHQRWRFVLRCAHRRGSRLQVHWSWDHIHPDEEP